MSTTCPFQWPEMEFEFYTVKYKAYRYFIGIFEAVFFSPCATSDIKDMLDPVLVQKITEKLPV